MVKMTQKKTPQRMARAVISGASSGLNDGSVGFAGLQRLIGIFRKRFCLLLARFWFAHGMGPSIMGMRSAPGLQGQARDLSCVG